MAKTTVRVIQPFGAYNIGDEITDPAEQEKALAERPEHVVRAAVPQAEKAAKASD